MENAIIERVVFFLQQHQPFSQLDKEDLMKLAKSIRLALYEANTTVTGLSAHFGVIRSGVVEQYQSGILIDKHTEGDLLLRLSDAEAIYKTTEDSILYEIPELAFMKFKDAYQEIRLFLENENKWHNSSENAFQLVKRKLVHCSPNTPIWEAAKQMQDSAAGSIIITTPEMHPIGILTDRDLRRIVSNQGNTASAVKPEMSTPVITAHPSILYETALQLMIRNGIRHLVITNDGGTNSSAIGVLSQHDLMIHESDDPLQLLEKIRTEKDTDRIPYWRNKLDEVANAHIQQQKSFPVLKEAITKSNELIIQKAIKQAIKIYSRDYPQLSELSFAWVSMGSDGRGEQMLRTDQDNAIICSNSLSEGDKEIIELVAKSVNNQLNKCGFADCPFHLMAQNMEWIKTVDEWVYAFKKWIHEPTPKSLLNASIFFDMRTIYGSEALLKAIRKELTDEIKNELFLSQMAVNALRNPLPLSFFGNFVLERSGEHKSEFDIKARAIAPVVDLSRVLSLSHGILNEVGTVERLDLLSSVEPNCRDLLKDLKGVFNWLLYLRMENGLSHQNDGRFLNLNAMTKSEKKRLKLAFEPIHDIMGIIKTRFRTAYLHA